MSATTDEDRIDHEIHSMVQGADPFAAAMRATRMPMLITDPGQPDNPIVFVNAAFSRLTGYTREEILGRNCRFLQGPGTNPHDIGRIRQAITDLVPIEIDLLNYKKDGGIFWNRVLISPVFDDDKLTYFFASQLDVTRDKIGDPNLDANSDDEMRRRIADLTASEERLQFTLKAGGLGTWSLDVPGQRLVASALCKQNFGRDPAEDFGYADLKNSIHPDDRQRWSDTLQAAFASDGDFNIDYRIILPRGGLRWVEIRAQTRFDDACKPLSMSGVSIDITDRKEAEAYRALITQEMSHRIKNTLATVQAIVTQSMRTEMPHAELQAIISSRINALSTAHDLITGQDWDMVGLRQTIERAVRPFAEDGRMTMTGAEMEISHQVSSALTLALHELATNAVKYGALSVAGGSVAIAWATADGQFTLTWIETGGPVVSQPTRTGFGTRMIERALASTVQGTATVDYRPDGIRFELNAALAGITRN